MNRLQTLQTVTCFLVATVMAACKTTETVSETKADPDEKLYNFETNGEGKLVAKNTRFRLDEFQPKNRSFKTDNVTKSYYKTSELSDRKRFRTKERSKKEYEKTTSDLQGQRQGSFTGTTRESGKTFATTEAGKKAYRDAGKTVGRDSDYRAEQAQQNGSDPSEDIILQGDGRRLPEKFLNGKERLSVRDIRTILNKQR